LQVRLFSSARMVVGPASAAFTFSPFMAAGTDLVEIFPPLDLVKHYCYISRAGGATWSRYTAVDTVGVPPTTNFGNGGFNMVMRDPAHFVAHLENLLANPQHRAPGEPHKRCKETPPYGVFAEGD
jgi:hypothetical protein